MSKDDKGVEKQDTQAPTQFPVTLNEFCARLSETVRRPELIRGFHYDETANGNLQDTDANYRARYDQFINKPV